MHTSDAGQSALTLQRTQNPREVSHTGQSELLHSRLEWHDLRSVHSPSTQVEPAEQSMPSRQLTQRCSATRQRRAFAGHSASNIHPVGALAPPPTGPALTSDPTPLPPPRVGFNGPLAPRCSEPPLLLPIPDDSRRHPTAAVRSRNEPNRPSTCERDAQANMAATMPSCESEGQGRSRNWW